MAKIRKPLSPQNPSLLAQRRVKTQRTQRKSHVILSFATFENKLCDLCG